MVDWRKIKSEYMAGGTSYRKLSAKHGVSRTAIQRRANEEHWVDLKSQTKAKINAKITEEVSDKEASKAVKILDVADKLINKLSETIDKMEAVDPQSIKQFTSALKDLKDIKGFKSDIDLKEQNARIAKLEKEANEQKTETQSVVVRLEGDIERWSK